MATVGVPQCPTVRHVMALRLGSRTSFRSSNSLRVLEVQDRPEFQHLENLLEASVPQSLPLPESIYGAAMAGMIVAANSKAPATKGVCAMTFAYAMFNIVFQFFLLVQVKLHICAPTVAHIRALYDVFESNMYDDQGFNQDLFNGWDSKMQAELCQVPMAHPLFFWGIMVVWTFHILQDIKETMDYMSTIYELPSLHKIEDSSAAWQEDDRTLVVTAVGGVVRFYFQVCVLLPKLFIACALWLIGARWLTATASSQDLILNAMALGFIVNFDELLYAAVIARGTKEKVAMITLKLPAPPSGERAVFLNILDMVASMGVAITLPLLYIVYFQQVLPQYHWDVQMPCRTYFARIESSVG